MGSSYRFRVLTHIVYSAIITCLVEVFLITNLSMVARYIQQSGKDSLWQWSFCMCFWGS